MRAPQISTGGYVEPVPVPLEVLPLITPRPDLTRWDGIQLDPVSTPPDVSGLTVDEAVAAMSEWFLVNFEDSVHSTPRNDGEFIYLWGGPYEASDIMHSAFGGLASTQAIDAAVDDIEREGSDWVPNANRVPAPDEPSDEPPDEPLGFDRATLDEADPGDLHDEMLRHVESVEELLAQLPPPKVGIGHNNPPESIEGELLTDADRESVQDAVETLKGQPNVTALSAENSSAAFAAANLLRRVGERLKKVIASSARYAATQADNFITAAVKAAGAAAGAALIGLPIWYGLPDQLIALGHAAMNWLIAVGGTPF